jgi:hypothetical protein
MVGRKTVSWLEEDRKPRAAERGGHPKNQIINNTDDMVYKILPTLRGREIGKYID